MTNEELRKAIDKYQEKHPLHFGTVLDVTTISSKEGADIISETIEQISKKVDEDTELWCICEMAKLYMQGVKPVYSVRPHGEWIELDTNPPNFLGHRFYFCSKCNREIDVITPDETLDDYPYCHCGACMIKEKT